MVFLTLIQGGKQAEPGREKSDVRLQMLEREVISKEQTELQAHVGAILLGLIVPKLGITVSAALAVIQECVAANASIATTPWVRYSSALNLIGIFVQISMPDDDLDVPAYLSVTFEDKLIAAFPYLEEFRVVLEDELEFA